MIKSSPSFNLLNFKAMKKSIFVLLIVLFTGCGQSQTARLNGVFVEVIPGLTASDVHGNFTNKGFVLEKLIDSDYSEWTVAKENSSFKQTVKAIGVSPSQIVNVIAESMDFDSDEGRAADFLGYVASIPYKGSKPAEARKWVEDHINEESSTDIGGVIFKISGNDKVRILAIEKSKY